MNKSTVVTEERAIWGFIRASRTVSADDIQRAFEMSPQTANYWLGKFTKKGYLEKVRVGKLYLYAVSARGLKVRGDTNTPDTYRPEVSVLKSAENIPIHAGYICNRCESTYMRDIGKSYDNNNHYISYECIDCGYVESYEIDEN